MAYVFVSRKIHQFYNYLVFAHHKVCYVKDIIIKGIVYLCGRGNISIGKKCKINSGRDYNTIGGDTRTVLYVLDRSSLKIGNNVGISNSTIVASKDGVEIGNDVLIGGSCKIYDTDFHSIRYEYRMEVSDINIRTGKVTIKDGAFVGGHSILLKEVQLDSIPLLAQVP